MQEQAIPRLTDFLAAFSPDEDEPIYLRAFKAKWSPDAPDNRPIVEVITRRKLATDAELQNRLVAANKTRGWYFVVNAGGNSDAEITRFSAFFAEIDDVPLADQHRRFDAAPIQPSIRLETRKSIHAYWLIDGDCSKAEWRDIQARLIAYFGGDGTIKNPSRVMRLPYFNHVHYDVSTGAFEYKRVELNIFEPDRHVTVAEMRQGFAPAAEAENEPSFELPVKGHYFHSHEERHAELCQRIMARGTRNSRGHFDAQCLAHNGKGKTALVYFPDTGAVRCNAGCGYDALLTAEGLPAGRLVEKWEPPAAFDEYDLPDFPVTSFPAWLRAFVQGVARETQTPVDLAALLTLSVCAGAVAGKVRIEARRGWSEPLNLYTVTALPPANRKSGVFAAECRPLEERERELVEEKREEIAQAESEYRMLEERRNRLEKEAAKIDDSAERRSKQEEAIKLAQELASLKVPALPRLICADVTPERLASLLAEQGGRMCLFSPEGDLFDMLAGRYTGGNPNFDVILKGHSGDALRVDRRTRSEFVQNPALTIGLTVQPDVIRGLVDKQGFRGRGLIGRFLYCIPKSTVGRRLIDAEPLESGVRQTYENNIKALERFEATSECDDTPGARMLFLNADANTVLKEFETELEPQLAEDGELGMMSDWGGKLAGAVLRIAGLLHLAEHAKTLAKLPERVNSETMSHAITIGRYLIPHAKAAYAEMGADAEVEKARQVLRWIEQIAQGSFTKRDAHQAHKGRFKKVTDIEPALELLEAHGYIRARIDATDRRPGRKPSQVFDVNPFLLSPSHNSHNSQNKPLDVNSENSEKTEDVSPAEFLAQATLEGHILEEATIARERVRI